MGKDLDGFEFVRRVDHSSAWVEDAGYFGGRRLRMFGCIYRPAKDAALGALICSPLHAELERNYTLEVLLARALAEAGIAVGRFHYRGAGHSDGDSSLLTFGSTVGDALEAADWLRNQTGVTRIVFTGTRWGALVAAAASRVHKSPLAMWEPLMDGREQFRNAVRAKLAADAKASADTRDSPSGFDLERQLLRDNAVDILGYEVTAELYESANSVTLKGEVGDVARHLLLIQISHRRRLRENFASLTEMWRNLGFDVSATAVKGEGAWWLTGERWQHEQDQDLEGALLVVTRGWVANLVESAAWRK